MVSIDSIYSQPKRKATLFKDPRVDEIFSEGIGRYLRREMDCPRGKRLNSRLLNGVSKGVSLGFIYAREQWESVAEEILLAAAVWSVGLKAWEIPFIWCWPESRPTYPDVVIVPQQPISCYRVDLAIHARKMRLVIEVDGHEWHEKTKEQAARDKRRDRDLQQEGWNVFHFTGSEVWCDPFGCCEVINKFIQREMPA